MQFFMLGSVFAFFDVGAYLFEFSLTHVGHLTWSLYPLGKAMHDHSARCISEKFQFGEVFSGRCRVVWWCDEADEEGCFSLRCGGYKFLHTVSYAVSPERLAFRCDNIVLLRLWDNNVSYFYF